MDPYIEVCHLWDDFHHGLISEIKGSLASRLPERYVVRAGERRFIALVEALDEEEKPAFLPDALVATRRGSTKASATPKASAAASVVQGEPGAVLMRALVKAEYREPFLEIRQVDPERKLVTGIEVLSPSNKRPNTKGWRLYHRKRLAFLSGYANFVEIDLLRRGRRMPMASAWPDSPYYLLVCRKKQAPRCSVWPAFFTEPLPPVPIPLLPPDPDISLDLQPFVAAIYARSRYERDIDYRQPLTPPLSPADAAWLEERLPDRPQPT
jgi:hypothetical protein